MMPNRSPPGARSHLTDAQREEMVHLYESGVLNGVQLARRYRVHRDVIYRHLKSARAVKGRLVRETTRQVEAELDARQCRRELARLKDEARRLDALIESGAAIEQLMKALLRADREGKLIEFGRRLPTI